MNARTKDLTAGVKQAKIISRLFVQKDRHLIDKVLKIDDEYSFLSIVASQNWIGYAEAQDPDVPIIKVWHLLSKIEQCKSLSEVLMWLKNREYLPLEDKDYSIVPLKVSCGQWTANWYGLKPH